VGGQTEEVARLTLVKHWSNTGQGWLKRSGGAMPVSRCPLGNYTFFPKYFLENEIFLDNPKFFGLDFLRK
jgi:hypothetical protein